MLLVCLSYLCVDDYYFAVFSPWKSLVGADIYWVSVNITSFCAIDALFATLTRGGWTFSLLFSSIDLMTLLFTVLYSISMR